MGRNDFIASLRRFYFDGVAEMKVMADLHLHSKYSRAVSGQMELQTMAEWAEKKGIDLLASGDWTHPAWLTELEAKLEEDRQGIYKIKSGNSKVRYVLSGEIANIYKQNGAVRRVHTVFMAPNLAVVRKINQELMKRGGNLASDGRPILGLSLEQMCELVWTINERVIVMPAHAWTPWFAVFGSKSGFDSLAEAFGQYASRIKTIETGLSSDPAMNWQIKELVTRAIVSTSDAHSPRKMGREATVFEMKKDFDFEDLREAMEYKKSKTNKIDFTIEFYPQEGKYHYSGHRKCGVVQSPAQTRKRGRVCHVCGKPLTVGVMHRVEEVGERQVGNKLNRQVEPKTRMKPTGVKEYYHPIDKDRPAYVMLVPLEEIVAESVGVGRASKKVQGLYERMIKELGNEYEILLKTEIREISRVVGERVAEGVSRVRRGQINIQPGSDGQFGKVQIWGRKQDRKQQQQSLF